MALVLLGFPSLTSGKPETGGRVFPYPIHKRTLENGLDVVVIETPEFKDVLSYNTLVLAGARNEIEPGKTGLAHLFEHILFRHRYKGEDGGYDKWMMRLGTHNNAWTWFDVTYYHPLTFTANLTGDKDSPGLLELESSRFTAIDFDEKTFRTEAGAVLGEYRRSASFPSSKMSERMLALLFPHHSYGHTTIGTLEDVMDMPNEYEAALKFYSDYYRPNNCIMVVAGDVRAKEIFAAIESAYGGWKPKETPPIRPTGEPPRAEQREQVGWDADVAPLVWVAYRMPAFRPDTVEGAVAQILNELLVSEAAPLYKKLRYEKKTAGTLSFGEGSQGFESFDARVLTLSAQLFKDQYAAKGSTYFDDVIADMKAAMKDLARYSRKKGARGELETLKSKYRYDFLAAMSSPANISQNFAWYYRFTRDPEVFEKMLQGVAKLTPRDIDRFARKYFVPENSAILTLSFSDQPSPPTASKQEGAQ